MGFYDAHVHFFFDGPLEDLKGKISLLKEAGFAGINVLVISEFPPEKETYLKMIPGAYHGHATPDAFRHQKDPFEALGVLSSQIAIVPFLDARFIGKDIAETVKRYWEKGFKGLKLLYVPEEDSTFQIGGMEKTFGRTLKESEEITSQLIDQADSLGWPVLMHVDLRRYGEFAESMLRSYPRTPFNIPHFGFSRKAISSLLKRYPNCFTDTSSLFPYMEQEPAAYRDFIKSYQDRILFGSDAVIGEPEKMVSVLNFMKGFLEDEQLLLKIAHRNYLQYMAYRAG
ncbi:MAG: amidohydrolase [Desulfobacterota bacterium]|nr:amidohydrolase [Thermodesulfobacteriota bacterium]